MASDPLHVVAFPWLAFGHMLPFLELSKSLAERGHRVSFISTPRNLQRLPRIPPGLSPLLDFVPFPLPHVDGLPPGAESTNDVSPDQIQYLKKALDGLKTPFADFLKDMSEKPNWIIVDFAHYWLPRIAAEFGIPCAYFSIFPASTLAFFGPSSLLLDGSPRRTVEEYTAPPAWIPSSFGSSIAYRLHEARWVVETHSANASGVSDVYRHGVVVDGCKLVAVRTVTELESDWLRLLADGIYKKPVVPVGLLPPAPQPAACRDKTAAVVEWLDEQSPGTVVYVAFGSEAVIPGELVRELAFGLELSNAPFLWAYRKPSELPAGFEDRVRGRGLVAAGWVPQLEALAHRSVGAFFTHCGASSVIEALRFGLPLIMLPLIADQGLIARVMAEKFKVGVEVPRDEQDGSFTRAGVAEVVRMLTAEERGRALAAKAKELTEIFADDGSSSRHMDEFVSCLRNCVTD